MIPGKLSLVPFTEGDDWAGIPSLTITVNGVAPPSAIASVRMRFKKAGAVPSAVVELISTNALQINILNAATWHFRLPEQTIPGLTFGKWAWRIRITSAAGRTRTFLADEITVLETV